MRGRGGLPSPSVLWTPVTQQWAPLPDPPHPLPPCRRRRRRPTPVTTQTALLTIALGLASFSLAGLYCNHADLSPRYACVLLGMTNTSGALPGIVGVAVTGGWGVGGVGWGGRETCGYVAVAVAVAVALACPPACRMLFERASQLVPQACLPAPHAHVLLYCTDPCNPPTAPPPAPPPPPPLLPGCPRLPVRPDRVVGAQSVCSLHPVLPRWVRCGAEACVWSPGDCRWVPQLAPAAPSDMPRMSALPCAPLSMLTSLPRPLPPLPPAALPMLQPCMCGGAAPTCRISTGRRRRSRLLWIRGCARRLRHFPGGGRQGAAGAVAAALTAIVASSSGRERRTEWN